MISLGMRIFPTSCSRATHRRTPFALGEAELLDHGQREGDHVAAVLARVAVVGLDDVTEQEGGTSVGVSELELVVDPDAAGPSRTRRAAR